MNVVAGTHETDAAGERYASRTNFSPEELMHFSRLITIGELFACFAHEVTNPLMLIRGHVRFMEESVPEQHPLRINFEIIERASRRIEEIAKRLLDFSRKRIRQIESCEIDELISDALRFVQPYLRSQYIDVQVHLDSALPAIDIDRWQMLQVLINILQNGIDAMAEVEKRVLAISSSVERNFVQIAISDTVCGILPAKLQRIFDPFFTTKGERGTGLGLFIAKQVIEEHEGSITVD